MYMINDNHIDLYNVTVGDCIDLYEFKGVVSILSDGMLLGFEKDSCFEGKQGKNMTICTDKCTSCVNGELIQKSRADIKIYCEAKDKLLPYGCKVECEFFEKKKGE